MPMPLGWRRPIEDRIKKFTKRSATGCLEWTGSLSTNGYAVMNIDGKRRMVSHVMLEAAGTQVPEGMYACHRCDNPKCVEPAHLFVGTAKQNMEDALSKGRIARGSAMPQAVLTEEQVAHMKRLLKTHTSQFVSEIFGVSRKTAGNIANGRSWKHVTSH